MNAPRLVDELCHFSGRIAPGTAQHVLKTTLGEARLGEGANRPGVVLAFFQSTNRQEKRGRHARDWCVRTFGTAVSEVERDHLLAPIGAAEQALELAFGCVTHEDDARSDALNFSIRFGIEGLRRAVVEVGVSQRSHVMD